MSATIRPVARAIILTERHEVLLMRMAFPWLNEDLWILPGGGIEAGESPEQAVEREIFEETGARGLSIEGAVWHREFHVEATATLMKQQYFLVRSERYEPQATELLGNEGNWLKEYRWWQLDALLDAPDLNIEPANIAAGIQHLLKKGLPAEPYDIDRL